MLRIRLVAGLLLTFFAAGGTSPAFGYIPPSGYLLKKVVARHRLAVPVSIYSVLSGVDSAGGTVFRAKKITHFFPQSQVGVTRITHESLGDLVIHKWSLKNSTHPSEINQLRFQSSLAAMEAFLISEGVPLVTEAKLTELPTEAARYEAEQMRMERVGQMPAWVLGRRGSAGAELWLDKVALVPVRWVSRKKEKAHILTMESVRYAREIPLARKFELTPLEPNSSFAVDGMLNINRYIEEIQEVTFDTKGLSAQSEGARAVNPSAHGSAEAKISEFYLNIIE